MKKLITIVISMLTVFPYWANAGTSIDRTEEVDKDAQITVINVKGHVNVTTWNKNKVSITGVLGTGSDELSVINNSSSLIIEVRLPRNSRRSERSELEIRIPQQAALELDLVSADAKVSGVEGDLTIESVSGEVIVTDVKSEKLRIVTVSGDVDYSGDSSENDFTTVSGELTAKGVHGRLTVKTVSGDIDVEGSDINRGRFETVSGDLELFFDFVENSRLDIDALSGDVNLVLPQELSSKIRAETFSGRITSDFGIATGKRFGSQKDLDVEVGDASGRIKINSFSGDIDIKARN